MSSSAPGGPPTSADAPAFDWEWADDSSDWVPPAIDPTKVSAARIYDYFLDGKDNFEVDRLAAEHLLTVAPYARDMARANRGFMHRAVRHIVRDLGVQQIIDVGTGIPTSPSVHEVAREQTADVRIVYADNDPVVLAHNRAVLATEPGTITLLRDLHEPDTILFDPAVRSLVDFERPVGLLFVAVLHFVSLDAAPSLLARFREVVPPGSTLAISALCRDRCDPETLRLAEAMYENSSNTLYPRTTAQVEQLFEGFRLVSPLSDVTEWGTPNGAPAELMNLALGGLAGVGIKE
jgi:hypothetical protein